MTMTPMSAPATAAGERALPDGWRWTRLGQHVTKVGSGSTPSGGQAAYLPSGVPLIRSQNVLMNRFAPDGLAFISREQDEAMIGTRVVCDDVLLNITGASIGRVCVVPPEFCPANVNQHVSIIRSDGSLAPTFLAFFISCPTFQDFIRDLQAGATRPALTKAQIEDFQVPLAPVPEQRRIAAFLTEQMAAVERARRATEEQADLSLRLVDSYLRHSLSRAPSRRVRLRDCLIEVSKGVGDEWHQYPVVGATRAGIAPAKENVGKSPERYKLVDAGAVFYNPMRILLGSIAMVDEGDEPGITSPDYVVVKAREGLLHPRWFYYWFRSHYGEAFIKTLTRGAVRERLLFRRLADAQIDVPPWNTQVVVAEHFRSIGQARRILTQQLDAINQLPAALLRRAFSGGL